MPVITVEASKKLSKEEKKNLIRDTSEIVSNAFGLPVQTITIMIYENSPNNIGVGGKLVSEE